MRVVKEKAYAKINLYLDVLSRREDGFHDVKTVMHSVTLFDTITVSAAPSAETSVKMNVFGTRFLPTDGKNLASAAAQLFLERAMTSASIHIKLEKRIPIAAGLAGGSTDAAAVLRAMNKLFGKMFSMNALASMAAELGSDVAYCLTGKTALCEGRGEIITPLPKSPNLSVVIAVANERVSTPAAYKALDGMYANFDGSIPTGGDAHYERLAQSLGNSAIDPDGLFNVFEAAVLPDCKGASKIKARLIELGAYGSMMSGSGPSVFGVFNAFDEARTACAALRAEGFRAYYAKSV